MPRIPIESLLVPSDLKNLRESGLTDETIRMNGLRTKDGCLVFPYYDFSGKPTGFERRRPHVPRLNQEGKPIKYEQAAGSNNHLYIPAASRAGFADPDVDVFIVEGEKKALCLAQHNCFSVGIGGVWNWKQKKGSDALVRPLASLAKQGRRFRVVFDYDEKALTRRQTEQANQRFSAALLNEGAAEVYRIDLPPGPNGAKQGVDDLIVTHGIDAFRRLAEEAVPSPTGPIVETTDDGNKVVKIIIPGVGEPAFHGLIGRFLKAVEPHTEATQEGVLAHLLPAIGTLIGPGPHIFAGSKQPARLNAALVGPTNKGRKGTSAAPVEMLMQKVDADFWNAQRVSGLSSGEGLIFAVADQWEKDEEGNKTLLPVEKRLYVLEAEFSRILANIRREGNVLSQVMREAFDSGNLSTLTVNSRSATGAHVSIVAHVTPEELRLRLGQVEMANGFGNRFMWFYVESDKIIPHPEPIPDSVFQPFVGRLAALFALGTHCKHLPITLSDGAKRRWEEVYPVLREDRPGLAGAMVARASSMVLRTALIYSLVETWRASNKPTSISLDHLEAGLAVWKYAEDSAAKLFAGLGGDELSEKVLRLLADSAKSKTEMNRHLSPKQKERIQTTLSQLIAAGLIRHSTQKHEGAGRPTECYERVQ